MAQRSEQPCGTMVMSARMVPWFPEYPIAFSTTAPSQHGWIYVDKYGNRYADETEISTYSHNWWIKLSDFDLRARVHTDPSFIVFANLLQNAAAIYERLQRRVPHRLTPVGVTNALALSNGWIQQGQTILS